MQVELTSAVIRNPRVAAPDDPVMTAIARMGYGCDPGAATGMDKPSDHRPDDRSGCVLVVEDNRVVGILTEHDIVRLSAQQQSLENLPTRVVMSHAIVTLRESALTDLFEVGNLLQRHHIGHLPILDESDRPIGLLTDWSLQHSIRPANLLRLRLASEVMITASVQADPDVSVLEIAQLMMVHQVSAVVIVPVQSGKAAESGKIPIGILTEGDVVKLQALGVDLATCQARSVMGAVISVCPHDSLWVVQQLMGQHFSRHVVVTSAAGELLGMVTLSDLLRFVNPMELYRLTKILEAEIVRLEAEKVELLASRMGEQTLSHAAQLAVSQAGEGAESLIAESLQINQILLQQQPEFLELVINTSPSLIFVKDWEGRYLLANRAMANYYDTTIETLLGKTDAELNASAQDAERFVEENRQVIDTQQQLFLPEECVMHPVLGEQWLQWHKCPINLPGQGIVGVLGVGVNITDRKQAEASIQNSELLFRTLFEQSAYGITFSRFDTDIPRPIRVNQQMCKLLGYSEAELLSMNYADTVYPDDRESIATGIKQLLTGELSHCSFERRYQRRDGTVFWGAVMVSIIQGLPGQPDLKVTLVQDISERKQAEQELRRTEKRLREAQRIAHLGNWELNLQTNALYWSDEIFQIFEIDPQEFGTSYGGFLNAIHPDDREWVNEAYNQHLCDRNPYNIVHRLLMPDGRIKYVQEQCESFYADDGTPLLSQGTVQDITAFKQAELKREWAEDALRQVTLGTATTIGGDFFPALVHHIAEALGVRYVSVSQATPNGFQTLAFYANGGLYPSQLLSYCSVPCCVQALETGECCHPDSVQELYPDNELFVHLQVESYLGIGLRNAAGEPSGNLCILHDRPLPNPDWARTLLRIFAARAGAELERYQTAQALEKLTTELEQRVQERTAQLREREAQLEDLFDNANDLIQSLRLEDGRFEYVNRAWREILGYSEAEVEQLTIFDVLHPDYHEHCQGLIRQMRGGSICTLEQIELIFLTKDRREILLEGNLNCRLEKNFPTATRAIFRDVTDRKRAEAALRQSETELRALFQAMDDLVFVFDREGTYLEVTASHPERLFRQTEHLLGANLRSIFSPDRAELFLTVIQATLNTQTTQECEYSLPIDDQTRWFSVKSSPLTADSVIWVVRDISDHKASEKLLQERESRYRAVMDHASDAIFLANRQGNLVEANRKAEELLGYSREELTHLHISQIHPPEVLEAVHHHFSGIILHHCGPSFETLVLRKDGSQIPVDITGSCIELDGEMIAQGIFRDIRDRKQAENALRESQQFLQTVLDTVPLSVFWKDRNSIYLGCNRNFLRDANLVSVADLIGKTDADLPWDEAEAAAYQADDQQVMENDTAKLEIIETQRQANGEQIWLETNKLPLRNVAGEIIGVLGTYQNITDRKRAQNQLQEQEQFLRSIYDGVAYPIFVIEVQHPDEFVYIDWNVAAEKASGIPIHTIVGKSPEAILGPSAGSLERQRLQTCLATGTSLIYEEQLQFPGQEVSWWLTTLNPLQDDEGRVFRVVGTTVNISDRKQAEQEKSQRAEREALLREISQRMRQSLDLQTIFDTACGEIRQVLQADRVGIFKFLPESRYNDGEFVAEAVVNGFSSVMSIRIQDYCFAENYAHLYAQGRYYVVDDLYQHDLEACHAAILEQLQVRALLVMPLLCGDELWGLLCIHQCGNVRHWQQSETNLGQQIANQLAIAIQQALLYEQVQSELQVRQQAEARIAEQLRQQRILGNIIQHIRESLDLNQILETVVCQVKDILQGDRVIVFRLFPNGKSQIVEEAVSNELVPLKYRQWPDEVWSQEILDAYWQGKPRIVPDVMDDTWTECLVGYSLEGQIQSKIVAPVLVEIRDSETDRWVAPWRTNRLWGVLVVHACHEKRIWRESEAQLLQQIADQLAIAIQQSSLFKQLQQELSERQQAQQQLTESNQQLAISNQDLARATRLKDEFLANMSHELRTPLNAILGMTEGLQEEVFGPLNIQQIKALRTVESSAAHLLALINDILDVAKIEAGQITLECGAIPPLPLCSSSLAFIKQQALKKRIQLETQLPPNLPNLVVDERRIRQVLINLLTNAVKFTPEGGRITLAAFYVPETQATTQQNYLHIAITDTGIGIAAENIGKLFQPFVQIDSALNRQYTGTGLGLSLVRQIVELHGGQVGVTSELGMGSCFTITLPCESVPLLSPESTTAPIANPGSQFMINANHPSPLILLAEDNEANISTIANYLEAKGYRILLARNGEDAVTLAQAEHPDLILMDIQMPGMDGLEAMQHIRRDSSLVSVPIIALTALAMTGDRERCLEAGANEYLAKPVRLKELALVIQSLLNPPLRPSIFS